MMHCVNFCKHDLTISSSDGINMNADLGVGIQGVNTQFDILE